VCEVTQLEGAARVADQPPAFGGIFERAGGIRRLGGPCLCARNELDDLGAQSLTTFLDLGKRRLYGVGSFASSTSDQR
jgi:hypothetical protein